MSDPAAGTTASIFPCTFGLLASTQCDLIQAGPWGGWEPGDACLPTPSHHSDSCSLLSPRRNPAEEGAGRRGAEESKGVRAKGAQGLPGPGIRCVPPQEDGRGSV